MKINSVFYLSAGLGTRMGEVRNYMPKPAMPFFSLPILLAHDKFIKQVYSLDSQIPSFYNSHYKAEFLRNTLEKFDGKHLIEIYEEQLLNVGGGVFNFQKKQKQNGFVLMSNSDQFLFFNNSRSFFETLNWDFDILMFCIRVNKSQGYNEVVFENDQLKGVNIRPGNQLYYTYAGTSVINLDSLPSKIGPQKYFYDLADREKLRIRGYFIDDYEYFDFGKADLYAENHFSLLEKTENNQDLKKIFNFLNLEEFKNQGDTINFSPEFLPNTLKGMSIDKKGINLVL